MGGRDAEDCLNLAIQGAAFDVVYCRTVAGTHYDQRYAFGS